MRITFWTYVQNCGDGSNYVCYFNSREDAETFAENDNERYCDDITQHTMEVDENGKILNPSFIMSQSGN